MESSSWCVQSWSWYGFEKWWCACCAIQYACCWVTLVVNNHVRLQAAYQWHGIICNTTSSAYCCLLLCWHGMVCVSQPCFHSSKLRSALWLLWLSRTACNAFNKPVAEHFSRIGLRVTLTYTKHEFAGKHLTHCHAEWACSESRYSKVKQTPNCYDIGLHLLSWMMHSWQWVQCNSASHW